MSEQFHEHCSARYREHMATRDRLISRLLFAGLVVAIVSAFGGVHPDMRIAYRHIAIPMALVAGSIVFVLALVMEVRHYRQNKTLSAIERMG